MNLAPRLSAIATAALAALATPLAADDAANRALVERVFAEFYNGRNVDTLTEYMAEDLIQHNPAEPNGAQPLAEFFEQEFWSKGLIMNAEILRVVVDGDMVFTHSRWAPPGSDDPWAQPSLAIGDIYRVEDGKLAEHWDVVQFVPEDGSVNGNTMFDGGNWHAESEEVEEANKQVVLTYFQEGINNRNLDALDAIVAEDWIAHNPTEPNGLEGLKAVFGGFFEQFPEIHADTKRLLADGNLVVAHNHYTLTEADRGNDFAPGSGATFDIFRLEDGVIVEHWDVLQRPVPETSANGNSMFDGAGLYNYRN